MQYESAVFHCGKPRFAVYWFRAVLLTSIPSRLRYSTSTYRPREIQKEERFPPNRRCGSVETCRKASERREALRAEAAEPRSENMAEVILKNIKKVYPNSEPKKKNRDSGEKKHNLQ